MQTQLDQFVRIIKQNNVLIETLDFISQLNLPNFYIAAGSVFQTIWNYYDNKPLNYGIKDIDVIYYDKDDLSKESEKEIEKKLIEFFSSRDFNYECDVHNEARMHLWKKANERVDINQYKNSEDAIDQWIATVHAIGITKVDNEIKVYAPYGLSDIFSKTIRPIYHKGNTKDLYTNKVRKWQDRFDNLNIIEWD
jgi:hypothetical protein